MLHIAFLLSFIVYIYILTHVFYILHVDDVFCILYITFYKTTRTYKLCILHGTLYIKDI